MDPILNSSIVGTGAAGRLNSRSAIRQLVVDCLREGAATFDTAPLYGSGAMEAIVGEALVEGRAQPTVRVNTKFGLSPLISFAHPERCYFLSKLAQFTGRRLGMKGKTQLSEDSVCEIAMSSLERSIRRLGMGRIDVFFAHEVPVEFLMLPRFLDFVHHAKEQGLFSRFGLGGYRSQYEGRGNVELWNAVDVIQVESVQGIRPTTCEGWKGEIFLHGVLSPLRRQPQTTESHVSVADCLREAQEVQGAQRCVIGISRMRHFRELKAAAVSSGL